MSNNNNHNNSYGNNKKNHKKGNKGYSNNNNGYNNSNNNNNNNNNNQKTSKRKNVLWPAIIVILLIIGVVFLIKTLNAESRYSITDVAYDPEAKVITWNDDSEAEEWLITINGEEFEANSKSYSYDSNDGEFTVEIQGLHARKGSEKNPKWSGTFCFLPMPTDLAIKNGELSWNTTESYDVEVYNNGTLVSVVSGSNKFQLPKGSFELCLKPVFPSQDGKIYYSHKTESVSGECIGAPTSLVYENGMFKWSAVNGADFYKVVVNGEEFTSSTNSFAYPPNKKDMTISVSAEANAENVYSALPLEKICYYLSPVTDFSLDESGNLVWGKVLNADSYNVTVNGVNKGVFTTEVYTDIQIDTPYSIEVEPIVSNGLYYSEDPTPFLFEKLSNVKNIRFSAEQSLITWDKHARAESYEVIVNGEKFTTEDTKLAVGQLKGDLTVSVWAIGEGEISRSYFTDTVKYSYIEPIQNLAVRDGVLTWDPSVKAIGYKLSFTSGTVENVDSASYKNIKPGVQYTVKVIPYGENEHYFSYWSGDFTFQILPNPTLHYADGVVYWNGSSSVGGYTISILKPGSSVAIEENLSAETYSYLTSCNTPGKYVFAVKANPSPTALTLYESAYSEPITITRLETTKSHEIISNLESESDGVQIRFGRVDGASGYAVYLNGTKITDATNPEVVLDLLSASTVDNEQVFKIEIASVGSVTPNEIILDSLDKYAFSITRLATPQNVKVVGKTVSWDAVNKATKYIVTFDSKKFITTTTSYEFTDVTEGVHTVRIQAVGDPITTVASRYSTVNTITKLSTPKNVKIVDNSGEALLVWEQVTSATAYKVKIGDQVVSSPYNSFRIEARYINDVSEGAGLQLSVWAVGGSGCIDSEPSETKTISRFMSPRNVSVSDSSITWNDSVIDTIKATAYKVSLDNLDTDAPAVVYDVRGASFSMLEIAPGRYEASVYAVGDNERTLDSPAVKITVVKLGSISGFDISDDMRSYVWDAVPGAQKYKVTVGGAVYYTTEPIFTPEFTVAGRYSITVTPVSDQTNYIAGKTHAFEQQVTAMNAPIYVASADAPLGDRGFKIQQNGANYTITVAIPSGGMNVQYKYIVGGAENGPFGNVYSGEMDTPNWDYEVQIQFIVNSFGDDGLFYINSQRSEIQTIRYS